MRTAAAGRGWLRPGTLLVLALGVTDGLSARAWLNGGTSPSSLIIGGGVPQHKLELPLLPTGAMPLLPGDVLDIQLAGNPAARLLLQYAADHHQSCCGQLLPRGDPNAAEQALVGVTSLIEIVPYAKAGVPAAARPVYEEGDSVRLQCVGRVRILGLDQPEGAVLPGGGGGFLVSPSPNPNPNPNPDPAQELAAQTYREVLKLAKGLSLGVCVLTKKLAATAASASRGQALRRYDALVCTPLRLVHLIETESLSLHTVSLLVMDEADKLLELGFLEQVDAILAACSHAQLQRCLFSATMLPVVEDLATTVLRHPIKIVVGAKNAAAETVSQRLLFCGREEGKLLALRGIVKEGLTPPVLIFVQSKERAMQLFLYLHYISTVSPLHLHYISTISPLYLHYISTISPLHLH